MRIGSRRVNAEDTALISGVQLGMQSSSFTVGPLAKSEVCLRSFCRKVRAIIPETQMHQPRPAGWSAKYFRNSRDGSKLGIGLSDVFTQRSPKEDDGR